MIEWINQTLAEALSSGSITVYLMVFVGGLAASITPCTYPVLPLTVGFIGSNAKGSKFRSFFLSLTLVIGMALVYAVVGMVVAVSRSHMGQLWSNGWIVFGIAWFFILMALFLMDVFVMPVPKFMQKLQAASGKKKREGLFGAFIVGAVSGLVVGPCTGPILGVVIAAVIATLENASGAGYYYQILDGGLKLFLFGLGQGALIILCGTFAGLLARLPKSGQWMIKIKKAFALIIIAGASLLLVYAGQATDFPDLTRILGQAETVAAEDKEPTTATEKGSDTNANEPYGDEEFLE